MTLQISKVPARHVMAFDEPEGFFMSGHWTVRGEGVLAEFWFDHVGNRKKVFPTEEQAHHAAVVFMVAMQNAGNPAAMLAAHIEADFNKGCEE